MSTDNAGVTTAEVTAVVLHYCKAMYYMLKLTQCNSDGKAVGYNGSIIQQYKG